ncbi:MAG TPA: hypothetical protein PKE06_03485 [Flavilitoribacter sp.]|nr:hypothetical protein [Flavilitoribacter sp.]HMQ89885.1 hypothetical protein [Flavilitoribacter sp.]
MHKLYFTRLLLFVILGYLTPSCHSSKGPVELQDLNDQAAFMDDLYADLPFDMPRVKDPQFPGLRVNITDFGAIGDGMVKNTRAFADGISFKDITLRHQAGPGLIFYNTKNVAVEKMEIVTREAGWVRVLGGHSTGIHLDIKGLDRSKCVFERGASEGAVSLE